jgi:hypothetical protein
MEGGRRWWHVGRRRRPGNWEGDGGLGQNEYEWGSSVLTLTSLTSVRDLALDRDFFLKFKNILCRVLAIWHSAKSTLLSALWLALDKDCFIFYINSLSSVLGQTLGKELCAECLPKTLGKECLHFFFFSLNFLWCFSMLCRPTCSVLAQL